ncbi:MAG: hypothetical protein KAH21_07540, partial [Spirochaetaceae bacterium]|nr:hypothetical protein [Spirochaetaceae bacterium]
WISFDPTSDVMAPGEEYPFQFISPDEWLPLIEEVLTRSGEVSVSIEEENDSENNDSWWKRVLTLTHRRPKMPWILLGTILLLIYLPGRIIPGLIRMRVSMSRHPGRRVQGSWRLFAGQLSRGGYGPDKNETPLLWAVRIENAGIRGFKTWTELYLKAEYSLEFNSDDENNAGKVRLEVLEHWRKTAFFQRLKSLISPGWKGGYPW